jgi:rhamnose transport system substrate-binding protein
LSHLLRPQQWILLGLIVAEIVIFSIIGSNFLTWRNLFQVLRGNSELALIALALTPVILTGGIDLSVGSLLGLTAIVFGKLWRDAHLPVGLAAALALVMGIAAGGINALLITTLDIAPLIVTLGTYSLFRGIAEGITSGVDNFTGFPDSFLQLGQGHLGPVPTQLTILFAAIVLFYLLVHRSTAGRAWSAIGYSPAGSRHAGLAVGKLTAAAYLLCSLAAATAGLIYVARVGQAKADAGTGFELTAITAVVLGGTSIFGGRGSVIGTLMGFFAIALLENGMRLADRPPELAGILKGVLLIVAIGMDWRGGEGGRVASKARREETSAEEFSMRNSQLTVLCIVIVVAALIVAATNLMVLSSFQQQHVGQMTPVQNTPMQPAAKRVVVAMMPKDKGNAYFISCQKGAQEAAAQLGDDLLWDGPTDNDPARQNEIVDTWITRGVDVIAVSVDNAAGLSTALRDAKAKGIKVITFDADAQPDARDFFINQATPEGIGNALMDSAAAGMNNQGQFAIITASLTAANQNEWIKYIKLRLASNYPNIKLVDIRPCDDSQTKAGDQTKTILNADPGVTMIMAIASPAVPGAAEAVKQSGRTDVHVVGLGLPNENKPYVHAGITDAVILWNTTDLGYLTVLAADALAKGNLKAGDTTFTAGRLGTLQIAGDNILLGKPFVFNNGNIDNFDF